MPKPAAPLHQEALFVGDIFDQRSLTLMFVNHIWHRSLECVKDRAPTSK